MAQVQGSDVGLVPADQKGVAPENHTALELINLFVNRNSTLAQLPVGPRSLFH